MIPDNPFLRTPFADLFRTLLPDFVLGFAFFTALIYTVLGRRFGRQKPAVAMSAALGMALAVGMVWWEYDRGLSIRDLGPIALGFVVIVLCMIIFHAIRHVGGSWAGVGIAIGITIIVTWILGIQSPVDSEIVQTTAIVALTVGALAFFFHLHGSRPPFVPASSRVEIADISHDITDLHKDRRIGKGLKKGFRKIRRETDLMTGNPQERTDVMLQLRRMLPAEGWLTERLARLRERAHHMRKGHITRIEELRHAMRQLPAKARKQASREIVARYKELKLDLRLERLDKAVAENERRIKRLTREARDVLARYEYKKVDALLKTGEELQNHNLKLIKIITRTEKKLIRIAQKIAREAGRVKNG